MAVNPVRTLGVSVVDHSGEIGRFSIPLATTDDIDTIVADADFIAFNTALAAVIDGTEIALTHSEVKKLSNAAYSANGSREAKWLCIYQDNTTLKLYSVELPCRKPTVLTMAGTDHVDLTVAPWVAFKTAFDALFVSPDENAVTLIEVREVGRNV